MQLDTFASRVRKALLSKVHIKELEQLHQIIEQKIKKKRISRHDQSQRFAQKFLISLDLFQDKFEKKEEQYKLKANWQKNYQLFLDNILINASKINNIHSEIQQIAKLVPHNLNELFAQYKVSEKQKIAARSLQWFTNEKKFLQILINSKLLKENETESIEYRWSSNRFLWRKIQRGSKTTFEINHVYSNINSTLLFLLIKNLEDRFKNNEFVVEAYKDESFLAYQNYINIKDDYDKTPFFFQDIETITDEIRKKYFPDIQEHIQVNWLNNYSVRKLAHYNFKNDEISYSLVFDLPNVDRKILEFLAYHEILHKQLGLKISNKTIQAHTPEFKKLEQSFPDYLEIEEKIQKYLLL